MMHTVPQPGLTVLAVAGQLERGVRRQRIEHAEGSHAALAAVYSSE